MFLITVFNLPPLAEGAHKKLHKDIISAVASLKIPVHRDEEKVKVFSQFNKHMLTSFDTDIQVEIKVLEDEVFPATTPRHRQLLGMVVKKVVCDGNPLLNVYCHVVKFDGIFIV